jgi:DEAD/DEAH box helicase domain-containing protein
VLAEGVRVAHAHYGEGVVRRMLGQGQRAKVTVDFDGVGERLLIVEHAGLRILPRRTDAW